MIRWMDRLRMPLAVKCLLTFGVAVLLVLVAALWVPWQRMEQLTQQLNEKAAAAVVRNTIGEHTAAWNGNATTRPAHRWDRDVEPLVVDGEEFLPPRLIPLSAIQTPDRLTRFDMQAFGAFAGDPRRQTHWRYFNDTYGYRYAEPVYATADCVQCHKAEPPPAAIAALLPPLREDAATQPALPLLGIVSIEIPSQIESQQLTQNRVVMISAGLIAGMLAIVVFYFITTRLILQPVRVLQETCEKVSQGDLKIRSDVNTGDEFQQLSETFNTMLKNLQEMPINFAPSTKAWI